MPVVRYGQPLGFPPAFISKLQGVKWRVNEKCGRKEIKKIKMENGDNREVARRNFGKFVLYQNQTAWMKTEIFQWEFERLATFLKTKYPGKKFALLMDRCPSHPQILKFANLKQIFFPAGTTGIFQPLDLLLFAILKKEYRSWVGLYKATNKDGKINEEAAVKKVVEIFSGLSQNQIDGSFRRSKMSKFSKAPINEEDISEDDIMAEINCRLEELAMQTEPAE